MTIRAEQDKMNILLVDDQPMNLLALKATLECLNQNLIFAASGEEALRRTLEQEFAIILLDIAMPGMSGVEAATLIRNRPRTRAVPIVFLTAYQGSELDLISSYTAGGVDYLVKPFNPDILRAKVAFFLEMHRKHRELERQTELLRRSMLTIVEERKRTEDERRRRQELEEFAHIASHDLKEPLRAINTFTQLLLRDHRTEISADARECFEHIVEGSTRINRLIDDLIEYAQVQSDRVAFHSVLVGEIVKDVVSRLDGQIARRGAVIRFDELPRLMASPRQLSLVFEHLIDNALKFHGEAPPEISIRATSANGSWLFEVRDNGIGFDPRFADRIFLLFKRLHLRSEYEGTGFGLALCKKIIERHGGRIWAESEPGQGSSIFFALPETIPMSQRILEG